MDYPSVMQGSDLESVALSWLPNEIEKGAFREYLDQNPMLAEKLRKNIGRKGDPAYQWQIATMLNSYAAVQLNAGDFPGASGSLVYSLAILEENPAAWVGMAEVYYAWEDRIAGRWARKYYFFKPQTSASQSLKDVYSKMRREFKSMKERMLEIMIECSKHPEWRDFYLFKHNL